ncbi:hypothetical protein [Thioalkalivibrio sp.]|uniref:hypothetical protein n=1 Tax=Thioalkalivibrio sp. TaxID=2093813 RepID=UPI0039765F84
MRNNWIRIPLTILLVWLGWTGFNQGISGFLDDRDWSDGYLRSQAVIVDSARRLNTSASSSTPLQSCQLMVEYQFEGETYREDPVWLQLPRARYFPEEDCGEARYGEEVPVWIGKSGNEPMLLQPGNRSSKPMTLAFNLAQGVLFLSLAGLLWRPRKKAE